jgi:peptide/nickel transport system ATP-binding protein
MPAGCRFAPRCPVADANCTSVTPPTRRLGALHRANCHRAIEAGRSVWALPKAAE